MEFHLKNIGCIEKADIILGSLTVICGHNNTGKSYIAHSIYELIKSKNDNSFMLTEGITCVHSNSFLHEEKPELTSYIEDMLGIKYVLNNGIKSIVDIKSNKEIPLNKASASARSLCDLHLWLKYQAKKGNILFIEEPELNLHPANQRKIARLFVRIIKAGIKVFITTHSDYIIKELNNLIILNNQFENRESIMQKYNYTEDDVLDKSQVKVYITENNTLTPASIDDLGIEIKNFDTEIREMNRMFDDMTVTLECAYEHL